MNDPYSILGIPSTASQQQAREAYRRLVRQLHPDRTGGDRVGEERLKEVNRAYEKVCKTPPAPSSGSDFEEMFRSAFSETDFFSIFSGLGGHSSPSVIDVPLSFGESLSGVEKVATMRRWATCKQCSGSPRNTCSTCHGKGRVALDDRVVFSVPRGVSNEELIRARSDQGFELLARLNIEPSSTWARQGLDLILRLPIPCSRLRTAEQVRVASPYCALAFGLPGGVCLDAPLRLPGHGVRHHSGKVGDLLIRIAPELENEQGLFPESSAYDSWLNGLDVTT